MEENLPFTYKRPKWNGNNVEGRGMKMVHVISSGGSIGPLIHQDSVDHDQLKLVSASEPPP
jgi:hypothetical protein